MKINSQILTLLVLVKVALSLTNETLLLKTIETETIIAEPTKQNESFTEQNSLLNLTNKTLILETKETEKISTQTIEVQNETLSEESITTNSKENLETTTQIETIEKEITKKLQELPNDAVIQYITAENNLKLDSNLKTNTSIQPITIILENKPLIQKVSADLQTKLLSDELTNNLITESITIKPKSILEFKLLEEISTKSPEVQTKSLSEEDSIKNSETPLKSQSFVKETATKPLISLEEYAVKQFNFILDHILIASQEFVYKVLQATGNSKFQRDDLKRYVENLDYLLNPEDYYSHEEEDEKEEKKKKEVKEEVKIQEKQPEDIYTSVLRKFAFLKGKSTNELQNHLPQEWVTAYKTNKQEVSIWLDKASEKMRDEFNHYVSEEEDNLKYQYFNESFDDITRANEIHQKLAIIADIIKIVKNQKQISFMDLYMH